MKSKACIRRERAFLNDQVCYAVGIVSRNGIVQNSCAERASAEWTRDWLTIRDCWNEAVLPAYQ
jgi:hypothetical protein